MNVYKPPDKPFSAASTNRFFLNILFATLVTSTVPFCMYATREANPACGPLRAPACAGNMTYVGEEGAAIAAAAAAEAAEAAAAAAAVPNASVAALAECPTRFNYEAFNDFFLPDDESSIDFAGGAVSANATAACSARCYTKTVLESLFSEPFLFLVVLLLLVALRFARAQSRRLKRELAHTTKQLEEEHTDKVRLLRMAGVSLD